MTCNLKTRAIVIVIVYLVLFAIPFGVGFYYLHGEMIEENQHLVETYGKVTEHLLIKKNCLGNSISNLLCYEGGVVVNYQIYNSTVWVYGSILGAEYVEEYLETNFPVGVSLVCYYDRRSPEDLKFHKFSNQEELNWISTWFGSGTSLLIFWILSEGFSWIQSRVKVLR